MSQSPCRIATRNSPLALWQARWVAQKLNVFWPQLRIELIPMTTSGDRFLNNEPLSKGGGKGLFVKELENALLQNRADIAVHSMKDVPAECPPGLELKAVCSRENPYDALISQHHLPLDALPPNAKIGTSSLRRQSQLLALRPDLKIETLRGNIQTRLDKLVTTPFDAIVLAAAGLIRMNLHANITQILSEDSMLPACGQGALGIECRKSDFRIHQIIAPLNDDITALCVRTERQVNALLGGNCQVPVAVYCKISDYHLHLKAKVLSANGQACMAVSLKGSIQDADQLATDCAQQLFDQGAKQLLNII
ncbi:MAG TPA: hydroxymethylbilane synthase [Legionellaceae bacterium]|nr:hydroxymethylbilane synthase [Legionellaceae bacterium]